MLYQAYQTQSDLMSPMRLLALSGASAFWMDNTEGTLLRKMSASLEVFSRMRLTHSRPPYGITHVTVDGQEAMQGVYVWDLLYRVPGDGTAAAVGEQRVRGHVTVLR